MARSRSRTNPFVALVIGIVMIVVCLVLLGKTASIKKMHSRCTASSQGVVTNFTSERRTKKKGKHSRTVYYVYPTSYTYSVNDVPYPGKVTLSESQKKNIGDPISVYYNPSKVSEHYTSYENSTVTGGYITSGFFGLFGVIMIISGITGRKNRSVYNNIPSARSVVLGSVLAGSGNNGYNGNYNSYNSYNNGSSFNSNNGYNSSFGTNSYNNNGYNNADYNNNYNNNYSSYNSNGYNNSYNGSYNNNDFNQLN